jgi:hypothetical protein
MERHGGSSVLLSKGVMRRDEIVFMLEFEIRDYMYSLPNDPEQKLGQMTRVYGTTINADPAERDQFRAWGQMDGANKQLAAEGMKKPEGWKRNRGWGVAESGALFLGCGQRQQCQNEGQAHRSA